MSRGRLVLVLCGIVALARAGRAAAPPCRDGRFLLRPQDGPLIVGAAGRDAVTVQGNRVSIDSGCAAELARSAKVKRTRKGTRVTAAWDGCRDQQKVRLVATITHASGCEDMTGVRRARRSPVKRWVATRSHCGDGYLDPGNAESCDGGACANGRACADDCTCPPTPTTTSTSSTRSTSSTSSSSSSSRTSTTSTSRPTSTSTSTSSSTSSTSTTSTSTSLPDPCPTNPAGGPSHLVLRTAPDGAGGDLDVGWSGGTHNLPLPGGATLDVCLSGCDAANDSACTGTSPPATTGAPFGPPVPMIQSGLPFCLTTRIAGDVTVRTADYRTGEIDAAAGLVAELYLTTNVPASQRGQVCPQCSAVKPGDVGSCIGGRDAGAPCRLEATRFVPESTGSQDYRLSRSCRPAGTPVATVSLTLDPLGTGTTTGGTCPEQTSDDACGAAGCTSDCTGAACGFTVPDPLDPGVLRCQDRKGGLSERCCGGDETDTARPCHPTRNGGSITRTGLAAGAAAPFPASAYEVLAAVFCVPRTGDSTLDGSTIGLPGPGAVLVPVTATWLP